MSHCCWRRISLSGAVADGAASIAQELKPEVVVADLTMEPTRSAWAVDELLRIDNQPDIDWDTPAWETVRASELELHERPQGTLTAWPQRLTVAGSVRRHSTRRVNPPLRPIFISVIGMVAALGIAVDGSYRRQYHPPLRGLEILDAQR